MPLSVEKIKATAITKNIAEANKIKMILSGEYPDTFLKEFSLLIYKGANSFPIILGRILGITPDYQARLFLLENILEEEGVTYSSRNGLKENPQSRHVEWAIRFAHATGHKNDALRNSDVSHVNKTFNTYINNRDWLGAIAYYLAGIESNTPATFRLIVDGLSRKGYSDDDLAFFRNHITLDELHGDKAFEILSRHATDDQISDSILKSVRRGARHWWHIFN